MSRKLAAFQADLRKGSIRELWDFKNNRPMTVVVNYIGRGYVSVNKPDGKSELIWIRDLDKHWKHLEVYKSPLGQALL